MVHITLEYHESNKSGLTTTTNTRVKVKVHYKSSTKELYLLKEIYTQKTFPTGEGEETLEGKENLLLRFNSEEPLQWLYDKIRELQGSSLGDNEVFDLGERSKIIKFRPQKSLKSSRKKDSESKISKNEENLDEISIIVDEENISFKAPGCGFYLPTDLDTNEGKENISKLEGLLEKILGVDEGGTASSKEDRVEGLDESILESLPEEAEESFIEGQQCLEDGLLLAAPVMFGRAVEEALHPVVIDYGDDPTYEDGERRWSIGSYGEWAESNLDIPENLDLECVKKSRHLTAHGQGGFYPGKERVDKVFWTTKELLRFLVRNDLL